MREANEHYLACPYQFFTFVFSFCYVFMFAVFIWSVIYSGVWMSYWLGKWDQRVKFWQIVTQVRPPGINENRSPVFCNICQWTMLCNRIIVMRKKYRKKKWSFKLKSRDESALSTFTLDDFSRRMLLLNDWVFEWSGKLERDESYKV